MTGQAECLECGCRYVLFGDPPMFVCGCDPGILRDELRRLVLLNGPKLIAGLAALLEGGPPAPPDPPS